MDLVRASQDATKGKLSSGEANVHKGHCSVGSDVSFCSDGLEELRDRNESSGSPLSEGVGLTGHPPHRELGTFHSQGFH